jgi:hypothetical protein
MEPSLRVLYFVPLAILIGFGPYVSKRFGTAAIAGMMLTATLSAGLTLAILGGQHERNLTAKSALIGMLFAGLFFFLIIAIPTICLVDMGRHGDTLRRQRVIPLLIGIPILAVGYVFYVLGVGCALAGECM